MFLPSFVRFMKKSDYFPNPEIEEVCDFFDVVPGDLQYKGLE